MTRWLFVAFFLTAGQVLRPQEPLPKEWIDADTGHRVVRLTDDAGGSTLYFHDNAFSPSGDTMMINTPAGIAIVDVAAIGTGGAKARIVAPGGRGGYFARQTREIYFNDARGTLMAVIRHKWSKDGMWINLFRVQPNATVTREKLVNASRHNY